MAIGARSQSARTYLEKHLTEFLECSVEDLVRHGLRALRDTLPNEVELTSKVLDTLLVSVNHSKLFYECFLLNTFSFFQNVSIGVVGKGMDFTIYDDGGVESFLAGLDKEDRRGGRPLPPDVEEELKVFFILTFLQSPIF